MNKAMKSFNSFLAFLQIVLTIYHLIYSTVETELDYFPVLLSGNFRYRYFSVERKQKLFSKDIKVKRIQVYDDMECVSRCTRMGKLCKSVNYKKKDTDGLQLCELIIQGKNNQTKQELPKQSQDETYQHISREKPIHKTCAEVYKSNGRQNAVYNIAPTPTLTSLYVYCDMNTAGGGWTVIQKRIDGSVNFYRDWDQYKRGFGNKLGEFWLGLDNIHVITSQRTYVLRVDMEDFEGNTRYAEYEHFYVAGESSNYCLSIGNYSGDAGDAMAYHNNMQFSTKDRDNDRYQVLSINKACAVIYKGAWWFDGCHHSNPNGLYNPPPGQVAMAGSGIVWQQWKGLQQSLKRIEMKIRPNHY